MRKNLFIIFKIFIFLFILFLIFLFSNDVINSILIAIKLWKENIFTYLFPFFIISDLLINYGFVDLMSGLTSNLTKKTFNLPGDASFIIITSMLSGCPSNAKYIKELLDTNKITLNEAEYLLSFTHFPNPLFILGFVGNTVLNNKIIGIIILISIVTSNFIIGIFIKSNNKQKYSKINIRKTLETINIKTKSNNFVAIISNSIYKNINILLLILGILIIFFIITTLIFNILNISENYKVIISGLLEMTQGIRNINLLDIPIIIKTIIITAFLSFGGISIHMQVMSILSDTNIKYKHYLLSRITHALISCIIVYLLYIVFII